MQQAALLFLPQALRRVWAAQSPVLLWEAGKISSPVLSGEVRVRASVVGSEPALRGAGVLLSPLHLSNALKFRKHFQGSAFIFHAALWCRYLSAYEGRARGPGSPRRHRFQPHTLREQRATRV